jgi:hypothetical protein
VWVRDSLVSDGSHVIVVGVIARYIPDGAWHATVSVAGGGALNDGQIWVSVNVRMPLAAPAALNARRESPDSALLSWIDNTADETGFAVACSTAGVPSTQIAQVAASRCSVRVAADGGSKRWYRVRAVRDSVMSGWSNTAALSAAQVPALAVSAPVQGSQLRQGDTVRVQWLAQGVGNVLLSYSTDGGEYWHAMLDQSITSGSADWGDYAWAVPAMAGDSCLIEIADYYGTVATVAGPFAVLPAGVRWRAGPLPRADNAHPEYFTIQGRRLPSAALSRSGLAHRVARGLVVVRRKNTTEVRVEAGE